MDSNNHFVNFRRDIKRVKRSREFSTVHVGTFIVTKTKVVKCISTVKGRRTVLLIIDLTFFIHMT